MFIVGKGSSGEVTAQELLDLTWGITEDIERVELDEPFRRGVKTFARGFFIVDPDAMLAISMSTIEHESFGLLQRSNIIRKILSKLDLRATLTVNDLQEPQNSRDIMVNPPGYTLLHGEAGAERVMRHRMTIEDASFINNALIKVMVHNY